MFDFATEVVPATPAASRARIWFDSTFGRWRTIDSGAFIRDVGWQLFVKSVDQSKTSDAALANDNTMFFSMEASKNYAIRGKIFFDTGATGDFKYGFVGPTSPTLVRCSRQTCIAGGTPAELVIDVALPGSTALTGTGTTGGYVAFEMIFKNGSNTGTFAFQWAQNTSDGTATTVLAGSYMEVSKAN